MVYECENCETALGPGWMSCPRCGQLFDEPVPDDAVLDEAEKTGQAATPPAPMPPPVALPLPLPPPAELPSTLPATRRRSFRLPKMAGKKMAGKAAVALAAAGLAWIGYPFALRFSVTHVPFLRPAPTVIQPAAALSDTRPTDLAAHSGYTANMAEFVRSLRSSGVRAQWPAFGGTDTLLVTPQTMVNGQRAEWNADLYHELAQGIYANFVFRRYESKFSDTDSTTCFVVVSDSAGNVVAADLMGNLK